MRRRCAWWQVVEFQFGNFCASSLHECRQYLLCVYIQLITHFESDWRYILSSGTRSYTWVDTQNTIIREKTNWGLLRNSYSFRAGTLFRIILMLSFPGQITHMGFYYFSAYFLGAPSQCAASSVSCARKNVRIYRYHRSNSLFGRARHRRRWRWAGN